MFDTLMLAVLRSKAGGGNMTYHFPRRGASEKDTCVFLEYRVKRQQDEVKLALQAPPGQSPLQVRVLKAAVVSNAQRSSVHLFCLTSDTNPRRGVGPGGEVAGDIAAAARRGRHVGAGPRRSGDPPHRRLHQG